MITGHDTCRICGGPITLTSSPRYVCCNGSDCGCYGATLPTDLCSLKCYGRAETEVEAEEHAECPIHGPQDGSDCVRCA